MPLRVLIVLSGLLLAAPASAAWFEWPKLGPTDAELETIVRTGYSGAARHAAASKNYFSRDGEFEPLRASVLAELTRSGLTDVVVPAEPVADLDAARRCLAGEGVELEIATNMFGDGISLAAVTSKRVFSYHVEPRDNANVVVAPAADCT